jgi:hypothetical protein
MRVFIFILAAIASTTAFAQSEPFDFKGIALGSDISVIENNPKFSCHNINDPIADQTCALEYGETIAGTLVNKLMLYYYDGKLHTILIKFDATNFSQVAEALKEKYGGGNSKSERVQNRMGETFENRIVTWRKPGQILEATQFSGKLDTSSVMYRGDFALKEFNRRTGSTAKEKAKDL